MERCKDENGKRKKHVLFCNLFECLHTDIHYTYVPIFSDCVCMGMCSVFLFYWIFSFSIFRRDRMLSLWGSKNGLFSWNCDKSFCELYYYFTSTLAALILFGFVCMMMMMVVAMAAAVVAVKLYCSNSVIFLFRCSIQIRTWTSTPNTYALPYSGMEFLWHGHSHSALIAFEI